MDALYANVNHNADPINTGFCVCETSAETVVNAVTKR